MGVHRTGRPGPSNGSPTLRTTPTRRGGHRAGALARSAYAELTDLRRRASSEPGWPSTGPGPSSCVPGRRSLCIGPTGRCCWRSRRSPPPRCARAPDGYRCSPSTGSAGTPRRSPRSPTCGGPWTRNWASSRPRNWWNCSKGSCGTIPPWIHPPPRRSGRPGTGRLRTGHRWLPHHRSQRPTRGAQQLARAGGRPAVTARAGRPGGRDRRPGCPSRLVPGRHRVRSGRRRQDQAGDGRGAAGRVGRATSDFIELAAVAPAGRWLHALLTALQLVPTSGVSGIERLATTSAVVHPPAAGQL